MGLGGLEVVVTGGGWEGRRGGEGGLGFGKNLESEVNKCSVRL